MPFCEIQDARIYYDFKPESGKPTLMLSNSLGTNCSMWAPQMDSFEEHFSVLRYDSRGHGQSSVPAGPYSIAQLGSDVVELLDALGLEKVSFCGLSMGGMVGQWLGIHAPERLKKLILSNTAAKIGTEESWNQRIAVVREGGMPAVVPGVLERWFTQGYRQSHLEAVKRTGEMLLSTGIEGYVASCAAVRDMDQRSKAGTIATPTIVVFGAHDAVTPPAEAHFLLDAIAGARALELNAAHLANIEAASEFTQGVLSFLLH